MTQKIDTLFENLWKDYLEVTPSARLVHELLGSGKDLINDHIALRTFNHPKVNIDQLMAHLTMLGYRECGEYHFEAKKLYAKHLEHDDKRLPKVFISELLVEEFSAPVQAIINRLISEIKPEAVTAGNFLYSGIHWQLKYSEYQRLLEESEYAAWLAAYGFRANHFTVSINDLSGFDSIEEVNQTLKNGGFDLNLAGGEIKGSAAVMLEQSSTMADKYDVQFTDLTMALPSCFYEFAKRYPQANGELYTGFVAASADKIFESTNSKGA